MAPEAELRELVGLRPDPGLADEDRSQLPEELGLPAPIVPRAPGPSRRALVGAGATLTGVSLVAGVALAAVGAITLLAGAHAATGIFLLVVGVALISTHWGWVHVAELAAQHLEGRHRRELVEANGAWLEGIEPFERWSVQSEAAPDGGVRLLTWRHLPVPTGAGTFTFRRELAGEERHEEEEPAATVAERAELLRREAAATTRHHRERYEATAEALKLRRHLAAEEEQRQQAARAAARALSEGINSNLRQPPLEE